MVVPVTMLRIAKRSSLQPSMGARHQLRRRAFSAGATSGVVGGWVERLWKGGPGLPLAVLIFRKRRCESCEFCEFPTDWNFSFQPCGLRKSRKLRISPSARLRIRKIRKIRSGLF
jgi:hypothetical protein